MRNIGNVCLECSTGLCGVCDGCLRKKERIEEKIIDLIVQHRINPMKLGGRECAKKILNCPRCRKPMKRQIDPITKKRSKHIYGCKCNPKLGVSVG